MTSWMFVWKVDVVQSIINHNTFNEVCDYRWFLFALFIIWVVFRNHDSVKLDNRVFPLKNFIQLIELIEFIWDVCGIKLSIDNCKLQVMK